MESMQSSEVLEPLMDAEQVSESFGFSSLTIRRWAHEGLIPSIAFPMGKSGKFTHRFRMSELKSFEASLKRGHLAKGNPDSSQGQ